MESESIRNLNLWQKLAAISNKVGHIEKTGKNSHFGYEFMEHAQIVATLRPIMDEYGITVDIEALDATFTESKSTRVLLHMNYTVTNADKPEETFTRRWVSEAMDQQDKGINKALTAAEKNVFMKLFHISDVDLEADENDIPQQPARKAPAQATSRPVTPGVTRMVNPLPHVNNAPQNAPKPVTTPQPIQAAAPAQAATSYRMEDDPNFKDYSERIRSAKTLKELSDLSPVIKKNVVDRSVLVALRAEYDKRENILLDIENAKLDKFAGSLK